MIRVKDSYTEPGFRCETESAPDRVEEKLIMDAGRPRWSLIFSAEEDYVLPRGSRKSRP